MAKKTFPNKKVLIILVFLVLVASYFFYKTKYPKSELTRVYTNEKVAEGARSELIEGFPDIPVYPGLKLDKSYKREQDGKTDFNAFWYHSLPENEITVLYKWYIDELKKDGWNVTGPFADESENELNLKAENAIYKLTIYNSERDKGDSGGPPGPLIGIEVIEK